MLFIYVEVLCVLAGSSLTFGMGSTSCRLVDAFKRRWCLTVKMKDRLIFSDRRQAWKRERERLIHQQRVIELMSLCCTVFLNKNQCCLFWERRTDCKKMMNFYEWKFNSFLDNWYGLQIRPTFIYCIWRPLQIFKKRIRYSNPMKIDIFHYFMLHYFYHTQSTMWRTFFSSTSSTLTRPSYRLPPPLYIFL